MLQRHELEIRELHRRPYHPVLLQCIPVCSAQLLFRICAFKHSHGAQEEAQVTAGEERLIGGDARNDLEVRPAGEHDAALQEVEPGRRCRAEDAATVEDHAAGSGPVLVGEATALNALLGHGIASREQHCSSDGLREQRARLQLCLVPIQQSKSSRLVKLSGANKMTTQGELTIGRPL